MQGLRLTVFVLLVIFCSVMALVASGKYTVFYRIHEPPQIDAPPNLLDHVPEVSRPDLRVNAVYRSVKGCINDLFVTSHEIIQMHTKSSAVSQLITVRSKVAIFFPVS